LCVPFALKPRVPISLPWERTSHRRSDETPDQLGLEDKGLLIRCLMKVLPVPLTIDTLTKNNPASVTLFILVYINIASDSTPSENYRAT
jgi:hypothetical protein